MTTTGGNQKILFTKTIKTDFDNQKGELSDFIQVHTIANSDKFRFPFVSQPLTKQERVEQDFQRLIQRPNTKIFLTQKCRHSHKALSPFFVLHMAQG